MAILRIMMCLWLCASASAVNAQVSTIGTDFWFGFFENSADGPDDVLAVTITAATATSGVVSIPGQDWQQSFYVSALGSTVVEIPQLVGEVETEQFIDNRAIHLESNAPVSVFAANYAQSSGDATRVLPTTLLGTKYIAASFAAPDCRNGKWNGGSDHTECNNLSGKCRRCSIRHTVGSGTMLPARCIRYRRFDGNTVAGHFGKWQVQTICRFWRGCLREYSYNVFSSMRPFV